MNRSKRPRVVVVTGASAGVGRAVVREFQTRLSERRGIVYRVNHGLRQRGWNPSPVGAATWRDGLKYFGYRVGRRLRRAATGKTY
jgi:NAD(P)-dependent dehydrogenase (short-subunit alcohol dehydrogenase family)